MEEQEFKEKVLAALKALGKGTAEEVVKKMEDRNPETPEKELIARVHQVLAELNENGASLETNKDGSIIYRIP